MITAKFKDSPLGPIPQDWEVKRLGDVCSITTGHKDVNEGSELGLYPFFTCSRNVYRANSYSFDGEAILIAGNGEVGILHYYDGKFEAYQRTYVLMDFSVNVAFLRQYLSAFLMRELMDDKTGSSMPYIVLSALSDCPIPYPSEEEQQRIAEALGEVDKLIESLDEQIEKKRLIAKGVAHDLLTGKKRLPGFAPAGGRMQDRVRDSSLPEGWSMKQLGDCVEINPIGGQIPDEFVYVDLESVKNGCLVQNNVVLRRDAPSRAQRQFAFGDVLFQTVRPYQKNNLFVNFDASKYVASTGYAVLRERDGVSASLYIYAYLHLDSFVAQVLDKCTGTSYPAINPTALAGIEIALPELAEQQAIADLLGEQDAAIAALEAKREKYVRIKEGMMRDLLSGKVRMKGE